MLAGLDPLTVTFGMSRLHLEALQERPELRSRAFLLANLLDLRQEIADPVLEGADFDRTFEIVARSVESLVRQLAVRSS